MLFPYVAADIYIPFIQASTSSLLVYNELVMAT
jgi:hypothetical protein